MNYKVSELYTSFEAALSGMRAHEDLCRVGLDSDYFVVKLEETCYPMVSTRDGIITKRDTDESYRVICNNCDQVLKPARPKRGS